MLTLWSMLTWDTLGPGLVAALAFGAVGLLLLLASFKLFEWITPKLDIEQQLQQGNVAVGIAVAGLLIAVAIVVAAALQI